MFQFSNNRKTISDIYSMFTESSLIVDDSYQRRSVWNENDKIRLIETILLNFIIPELFLWKADTNPETGESITHIVDGQQRIKTIAEFVNNEFKLKKNALLEEESKQKWGDYYFKDLDDATKKEVWNYQLMIVDINEKVTRPEIINMFRRLNLTDYNLNSQEKRNSLSGEFASLARQLSDLPIWEKYKLFNNVDVKRMKDVEFCASLILLFRSGIIDQSDQKALNRAYEDLQVKYDDANNDRDAIICATTQLETILSSSMLVKFLQKKSQLYTIFSILFYMKREKIEFSDIILQRLEDFVKMYGIFDNDMNIDSEMTQKEKDIFDNIKKYKLASSEGLNKQINRMIRFNTLKNFLFNGEPEYINSQKSLFKKMEDKLQKNLIETIENSLNQIEEDN